LLEEPEPGIIQFLTIPTPEHLTWDHSIPYNSHPRTSHAIRNYAMGLLV